MAIKTSGRKLSEAELNAPDLDDDGDFDVEHYPPSLAGDIKDTRLRAAWAEAEKILERQAEQAEEEPSVNGNGKAH